MINSIIFSKDRAMQLDLLLQSIYKNAPETFNINVLYKFSDEEFERGYNILKEKYQNVNFISENDFKSQTLNLLNQNYEYSCFFTDDDIIYNSFNETDIIKTMSENPEIFCFSLRLGKNVKVCYSMKSENVLIPESENDNIIIWNWTKHYMDFGYPLSVDGHIFKTKDILKLSTNIAYKNPNTFEAALQIFDTFPKQKMAAYKTSVLVNTPVNIVQSVFENRKAELFSYSVKDLNQLFLTGKRISLEEMDFTNIVGCHQELELKIN